MDAARARELIDAERARVEALLADVDAAGASDRDGANEHGDHDDPAESLTAQGTDDAVLGALHDRLSALDRADARLAEGTYGRSTTSGATIPDERLEADPAAELTVEEAAADLS
jgi:DnaK suppressor protein